MRILIVARCKNGHYAPFITEQVDALKKAGVECLYFGVEKNGYIKQFPALKKVIRQFKPDIIHAHYGLCALFATFQHKVPVVSTYHGSDINNPKVLKLSKIAIARSAFNIFVSQKNIDSAHPKGHFALIPCGINMEDYPEISKHEARRIMGLMEDKKYILFAGAFDNPVKNAQLAKDAVSKLNDVELLELKGYTRPEVSALMHAADAFLMTSHSEGSPQVIKEALMCGCPIVSVEVGDVKEVIDGIQGCYIVDKDAETISKALELALKERIKTKGKERIIERNLSNDIIAEQLKRIYKNLIKCQE